MAGFQDGKFGFQFLLDGAGQQVKHYGLPRIPGGIDEGFFQFVVQYLGPNGAGGAGIVFAVNLVFKVHAIDVTIVDAGAASG